MIFEKTLNRKVVAAPKQSNANDGLQVTAPKATKVDWNPRNLFIKVSRRVSGLFRYNQESKAVKEPASMGKILNLMRCVPLTASF